MADTMSGLKRTNYCGELTNDTIGSEVVVAGWVQKTRDLGNLVFIDLRDRSGIIQLAFDDGSDPAIIEKAATVRAEFVLMAKGLVRRRESVNPEIPTGEIEVFVSDLRILAKSETPPFEITDNTKVKEELRLKYRYLDLRRAQLQKNLAMRHEIARITREYFFENDFLEIETPMMIRSTPEGARDYLVPSRIHKGKMYALPQSPQIYKQLLMIAGYDRYFQIARCFRDEDLRADRQPEFTQIDLEMSFVDVDDVLEMVESYMRKLLRELKGLELAEKFPRMSYAEAMERYGSDKPDTRYGMELQNISELVRNCGFSVFADAVKNGGSVRGIVVKGAAERLTRKEIDKLTEMVRGIGAKGLAFVRYQEETPACSFAKFLAESELESILAAIGCERGDVALFVADKDSVTMPVLGSLRIHVAKMLDLVPEGFNFLWITEFPFFEWDDQSQSFQAMHHPFTMPTDESIGLMEEDPGAVKAKAYDLVLNGVELLSGSIRITDPELQQRMFRNLGLTDAEIEAKFGFLVDAYRYAAPPHGGVGIGLDRLAMVLCGADNLRDVVAFPKVQNASELMSQCPTEVDPVSLAELGIAVIEDVESDN